MSKESHPFTVKDAKKLKRSINTFLREEKPRENDPFPFEFVNGEVLIHLKNALIFLDSGLVIDTQGIYSVAEVASMSGKTTAGIYDLIKRLKEGNFISRENDGPLPGNIAKEIVEMYKSLSPNGNLTKAIIVRYYARKKS